MKVFILLYSLLLITGVNAAQITAAQLEFFEKNIRPVLVESCYECHNSVNKKKGKLALDWKDAMLIGGSEGKAVIPGNPKDSLLLKSIKHEDDLEMPSKAPKLSNEVIGHFEKWISMGAPDPRTKKPTAEDLKNSELKWETVREKRTEWWSFQPLRLKNESKPANPEWQENEIDSYVYKSFNKQGLKSSPAANKYTLIRRLSLILRGITPKADEVEEFVNSNDPNSYDKLVDSYLASKEFGENWARHWMDWYRYANTHGSEGDPKIPFAEVYRDYLIRALNDDIPYNQLLKEHLAGDLLPNPRINKELGLNESAIGPAHLRMVPHGFGVTDAYDEQITFTDNQIDVISKAMLGLTVSCARCHNHKFDPVSQEDFHRFYGIMISNKASTIVVDSRKKQDLNKTKIDALKNEIRKEFADFWMTQIKGIPQKVNDLKLFEGKDLKLPPIPKGKKLSRKENQQRKKEQQRINDINGRRRAIRNFNHPLSVFSLKSRPEKQLTGILTDYKKRLAAVRKSNDEARKAAVFYLDLRDPKKPGNFHASGNGLSGKISPAGSYALNPVGKKAITGIYPAGVYSHLYSSKHAAVFATDDFYLKGKTLSGTYAGSDSQVRMAIRNYPMTHGGLHPTSTARNSAMVMQRISGKTEYWKNDRIHIELRTAKDVIPRSGGDRSWFGVSELYLGDKVLIEEGASLLDLIDHTKITSAELIDKAYMQSLKVAVEKWQADELSNLEAKFLQAFIEFGLFENNLSSLPKSLQNKINKYRDLEKEIPVPTRAPGVFEAQVVDMPLLARGNYKKEGKPVTRHFLEIFNTKAYSKGSGRLELAEDMISSGNTLKSRLLVNRLWANVFGAGIVTSTDNFGRLGEKPTHPELLDYLALNFEKNNWSIKKALRQMVTSRTFKSSSQSSPASSSKDPQNKWLSHFSPRRMSAEMIFDSLHLIAGRRNKRGVYDNIIRNRLHPFLTAFNRPTPVTTVSKRLTTNVPAQALTMMNNFTTSLSGGLIQNAFKSKTVKTNEEKVNALFMACYSRPPNKQELSLCINFLKQINVDWNRFAETLLNSKEAIYVY